MIPVSWIVTGVITVAAGTYVWHCEEVKEEAVRAEAIAEQRSRQNALQALRDLKAKERADEEYERRIGRLRADVKRLRDASASVLPPAPSGSPSPERACFDRAELDLALRRFSEGAAELVGEGAEAVEGLDTAKEWASRTVP